MPADPRRLNFESIVRVMRLVSRDSGFAFNRTTDFHVIRSRQPFNPCV